MGLLTLTHYLKEEVTAGMSSSHHIEVRQCAPTKEKALEIALDWWKRETLALYNQKSHVTWALSGGNTPKALYSELAKIDDLPWKHIFLYLVDERDVTKEDDQSNFGMILKSGLGKRVPAKHCFEMRKQSFEIASCEEYQKIIEKHTSKGAIDMVLLGMGSDGHTASLFPNAHLLSLKNSCELVETYRIPKLKNSLRRTLSQEALLRASRVLFYVVGEDKKEALHEVWTNPNSKLPAAQILRKRVALGQLVDWVVDEAAWQSLN